MKKRLMMAWGLMAAVQVGAAVTFDLYNDSALYSYLDDKAGPLSYTAGDVTATFAATGGVMNRTTEGFGINAALAGDETFLIEVNESLNVSFNQTVQITAVDFRNFESGEAINVIIGSVTNTIIWAELDNQSTDSIGGLSWNVALGDTVRFETVGATDAIAVDSFAVVPEPATTAMLGFGGLLVWTIRRIVRA